MNLKVGIVGLPNAGKSTLFNAILKKQVADAAPYPFCTIEPNIGVVPVPDVRLEKLAEITQSEEKMERLPPIIPAIVEFVDIAGLVKGASQGEGLGNKFLSHIREVNIICHVIRVFDDPQVMHTAGSIDPMRDKEIIEMELILADLQTLEKQQDPRGVKDKSVQEKWQLITRLKAELNNGKRAIEIVTDPDQAELIRDLHLLTMKPVVYVANVSETQLAAFDIMNHELPAISPLPISARTEFELATLTPEEQREYLSSLGVSDSGLNRLIRKTYETLGLVSFLTCGVKEVRAWTITKGTLAPQAAGVIHTDFEKKFIKADVVSFDQFAAVAGWKRAKELGKVRQEGRTYEMQDGDVVEFKIGS